MPLYLYDGKLLSKDGKLAIHEDCCCDDCDCPDCDICPFCCLTWEYWTVFWNTGMCECPFLTFHYNPGIVMSAEQLACHPDSETACDPAGGWKGAYWVGNCEWEIPGYWECWLEDDGGGFPGVGFAGCGILKVKLISTTQIELRIKPTFGPEGCLSGDCDSETADVITITLPDLLNGPISNVCDGSSTPPSTTNGDGLSSAPNDCVSEVQFDYTLTPCCPETETDCTAGSSEGEGGGGGGDPLGCCTNEDYTTTPDQTQEDCEAAGGNWTAGDCEGYP